ncbi:Carbohydrate Esterase Family 4 protein [Gigaspora rosea]|uniref:chitin deacetylase n=1 Tax=Gigaspora rosea TaxID=44941 RepID=A0A397UDN6_9GLOM|nr:Carbohydrate Esterase Family 4 protein [Gigaspora rosea]
MVPISLFILGTLITTVISQECVPYSSSFDFSSGYPEVWKKPTDTIFKTDEFKQLYKSIDWSKVPNIPPHKLNAQGDIDQTGYNKSDPDCWWTFNMCTTPKAPGINPDVTVCPEPNTLGLSYDDGPNCSHTVFYDFLKENNQQATMFFIGSNVADLPNEAQRALADGHHICIHTWSHPYMTTLTNEEVLAELYYTRKVIKYVMGVTPLCWRPPFGDCDDRVRAIAQALNLTTIIWNIDTNDWDMQPAGAETLAQIDANFQDFVNMGQNGTFADCGAILLEHELNNGTMAKAVEWYPKLKSAYQHVLPIASCMNYTYPYVETNYTYPSFAQCTNTTTTTTT